MSNSKTYCPLNLFAIVSELEELGKIIKIIIKKMTLIKDVEPYIPTPDEIKLEEVRNMAELLTARGYNNAERHTILLENYTTEIVNAWLNEEQK